VWVGRDWLFPPYHDLVSVLTPLSSQLGQDRPVCRRRPALRRCPGTSRVFIDAVCLLNSTRKAHGRLFARQWRQRARHCPCRCHHWPVCRYRRAGKAAAAAAAAAATVFKSTAIVAVVPSGRPRPQVQVPDRRCRRSPAHVYRRLQSVLCGAGDRGSLVWLGCSLFFLHWSDSVPRSSGQGNQFYDTTTGACKATTSCQQDFCLIYLNGGWLDCVYNCTGLVPPPVENPTEGPTRAPEARAL